MSVSQRPVVIDHSEKIIVARDALTLKETWILYVACHIQIVEWELNTGLLLAILVPCFDESLELDRQNRRQSECVKRL